MPPTARRPTAAPASASERLLALDVLRGFALYGVFVVNLVYSSGPDTLSVPAGAPWTRVLGWTLVHALFETKFVTIFSLLFGMGLVLQTSRQERRGAPVAELYVRRQGLLCGLGLAHGLLLFEGDILFLYSLVGLVLFFFRHRRPRTLVALGATALGVGIALSVAVAAIPDEGGSVEDRLYTQLLTVSITEGPLALTLAMRGLNFVLLELLFSVTSFNWRVLGLFFLGAAAMRTGLLAPERRRTQGRLAAALVPLGALLEAASLLLAFPPTPSGPLPTLLHELGSLALGAGFAATVAWCVHAGVLARVTRSLAAVGRMALTNYLAQSVLMNVLLYWFGFGLWGRLDPLAGIGLVTVLFGAQVVLSNLMLHRLAFGPAEWLWRSLTYGRAQPLRAR